CGAFLRRYAGRRVESVGARALRAGDPLAVLEQFRVVQAPDHPVLVATEPELELHFDVRPALGREPPDGVAVAACRLGPVDRPGHRLQQGRLARAVGPENARDPGAELDVRGLVLAEIRQAQAAELHQTAASRPACSTYSTPTRMKASRSRSASSGRRVRNPRTTSGSVWRRPGAPDASVRDASGRRRSSRKLSARAL